MGLVWYLYLSDTPCSHLETVCRTTFSLTASSCCESPFDFLIALIFSLSISYGLLSFVTVIVVRIARCHKQRILTFSNLKGIILYDKQIFPGRANNREYSLFLCYIMAMTAGQIGQTATMGDRTADLLRQLAERMIEQAEK